MKRIKVNASQSYDILIEEQILTHAGEHCLSALGAPCRLCIVTDDNVAPLYLSDLSRSLTDAGFDPIPFIIPNGEASKSTESLVSLLEFMAESRLTRADAVVALGGGVVGDLAGFASAIYLRGVRFVQIPTTLLAAVDSSVGGKTAVDLRAGKNLAGAFHQPSLVLCDPLTLSTLTPEIFSDGCAEVIKYSVINDKEFFEFLKGGIRQNLGEIIARCAQNKATVVEGDEFDRGNRQLLNLGHTVGHAIELCSQLSISHGSAVAIGMVIVTRAAVSMGLCPSAHLEELISMLRAEGLPTECEFTAEELTRVALSDKKRMGGTITLVVPFGIGDSRLYPVSVDDLKGFIEKGLKA